MANSAFWRGVIPAITTPFKADGSIDHEFLGKHANLMIDAGCTGIVPLGSLGEGSSLSFDEKLAIVETLVKAIGDRAPVIPGIGTATTAEAVKLTQAVAAAGARGLMVLPPYVYSSDWTEMGGHVRAIVEASDLPCMLYNNPGAYKTDFSPTQIAWMAKTYPNVEAVKETSGDIRRFSEIRELVGDRLELLVGMDNAIVEGIGAGATGWIAGQVNAYPKESVRLFELARDGGWQAATDLYRWFLPLLRLDVVPKFVQLIKLTQVSVDLGSETVRAPRRVLEGAEREGALAIIAQARATRPEV